MKSIMPPKAYICEEWFQREQSFLFRPLWQFIAPRMLLARPNAYVRRKIAGIDIVVQNVGGRIRAFENVCAHRSSPIQNKPHGIRPLVCPYHGWSYAEDGSVESIPFHDQAYRFDGEEKCSLALRSFRVHEFCNLVFVNLTKDPIDFSEQFDSEAVLSLEEASNIFDDEVLVSRFPVACNWKLAYENLRDGLHPRFVHSGTLYRQVKFEARIEEGAFADVQSFLKTGDLDRTSMLKRLRSFSGGGLNEPMPKIAHYAWHDFVERFGADDWYLNWLMYPNLHISSGSGGYSFLIEHHVPVSAGRTDLWVYFCTAKKKRKYPTSSAVLLAHLQGAEKVLREDIDIMEKVQTAITHHTAPAVTGDFEYANMAIEKWYLALMEEFHAI